MFNNIGGKIKTLAEFLCILGIICSVAIGFIMIVEDTDSILTALIIMISGALFSWISLFVLYGFGQLVENSDILVEKFAPEYKKHHNDESAISLEGFSDYTWEDSIKELSNEELEERSGSDEWNDEYRELCRKEQKRRKQYSQN